VDVPVPTKKEEKPKDIKPPFHKKQEV